MKPNQIAMCEIAQDEQYAKTWKVGGKEYGLLYGNGTGEKHLARVLDVYLYHLDNELLHLVEINKQGKAYRVIRIDPNSFPNGMTNIKDKIEFAINNLL